MHILQHHQFVQKQAEMQNNKIANTNNFFINKFFVIKTTLIAFAFNSLMQVK